MKILIIKLGALGDVVRTLPLAETLKKRYPEAEVAWVTRKNAASLFEGNPYINKVFTLPFLPEGEYDLLYNFDIEEEAARLALQVRARQKYGFYIEEGYPKAFDAGAEYYLNTIFDDETKKINRKTYQEMMFDIAQLSYEKILPKIYLSDGEKRNAQNFLKQHQIPSENLLGVHMGAGPRWPSKAWAEENLKSFIVKAAQQGFTIFLFGGPDEKERHQKFIEALKKENILIHRNNPDNSIREFAALVNCCQKMICSDSLALHISVALRKPTIGLFFCTPPWEVEGYGILKKLVSPILEEFFPEKMDQWDETLVKSITADQVLNAVVS